MYLNMTECEEKQLLQKNQTEENTFQYTSGMKGNELSIPNVTSSPNTSSQSSDDTLAVKETTTPSTLNIPLRRSTRTMKGIPPQRLVINWCDDIILSLWTCQCMILCIQPIRFLHLDLWIQGMKHFEAATNTNLFLTL